MDDYKEKLQELIKEANSIVEKIHDSGQYIKLSIGPDTSNPNYIVDRVMPQFICVIYEPPKIPMCGNWRDIYG